MRLVILPTLVPALVGAGLLVFALVFDDFVLAFFTTGVDPQPLPGAGLLLDPLRGLPRHQRDRHADAARLGAC